MAVTYRDEKGSPLSAEEVDENFRTLVTLIESSTGETGVGIANITQAGATITVHLTDATTLGPFELPINSFRDTGDWVPEFEYQQLDFFEVPNIGLYLVLLDGYVSGTEFDPSVTDTDGNEYLRLVLRTANGPQSINDQTDPGNMDLYPTSGYRNTYQRVSEATGINITVYSESALSGLGEAPFEVGDTVTFRQTGAGQLTLVEGSGVTITTPETLTTRKQGSTITLIYVGSDVYDLAGDLELLVEGGTTTDPLTTTGP